MSSTDGKKEADKCQISGLLAKISVMSIRVDLHTFPTTLRPSQGLECQREEMLGLQTGKHGMRQGENKLVKNGDHE